MIRHESDHAVPFSLSVDHGFYSLGVCGEHQDVLFLVGYEFEQEHTKSVGLSEVRAGQPVVLVRYLEQTARLIKSIRIYAC